MSIVNWPEFSWHPISPLTLENVLNKKLVNCKDPHLFMDRTSYTNSMNDISFAIRECYK